MTQGSATRPSALRRMWRKHYAVPPEHGAWVWWIGPLLAGAAAGKSCGWDFVLLTFTALAMYLLRQPLTLVVKVYSGRRGRSDLGPAVIWCVVYLIPGTAGAAALGWQGHGKVLGLALIAGPVLVWYFYLVSRKSERHQRGMEIATAGVLALAAPAAYWTCDGTELLTPWVIWGLFTLHSVASIRHVSRLLQQRRAKTPPTPARSLRTLSIAGYPQLLNACVAGGLALGGLVPPLVSLAFLLPAIDVLVTAYAPPVRTTPTRVGIRQLTVNFGVVLLIVVGYAT